MIPKNKIKAFSLIELSVLLLIFGGLAAVAVQNASEDNSIQTVKTVHSDFRTIEDALISYAQAQGHYPCPANPTLPSSNSGYAQGARDADGNCNTTGLLTYTDPTIDRTNMHSIYNAPTFDFMLGAVPCEDMGLQKDCMISPDGQKYAYVVSSHLSKLNPCIAYISDTANSTIQVPYRFKMLKDHDLSQTLAANYADSSKKLYATEAEEPEYILLYFGTDGVGSWSKEGTRSSAIMLSSSGGAINDNSYQQINHNLNSIWQMDRFFLKPSKPIDTPDADLSAANTELVFGDILKEGAESGSYIERKVCLRCRNCDISHQDIVARLDSFTNCSTSPLPTTCQ